MDPATVIALCKENIQPLRYGRNATQLGTALRAQEDSDAQQVLLSEKQIYEDSIKNYEGEDPLENWYEYIIWAEQSYPKNGHESHIGKLLQECLSTFEKDARYHQDRRFIRLWINYISMQKNPLELYQLLHNNGIGTMVADMYRAWAFELEQLEDYKRADEVYLLGLSAHAEPLDELDHAHKNFQLAVARKTLGRMEAYHETSLMEQRQAFSSLRAIRAGKKVSNMRTGHFVRSHHPGSVPQATSSAQDIKSNFKIQIYQDNVGTNGKGASILDHVPIENVQYKENSIKPGPWSNENRKHALLTSVKTSFKVHEDQSDNFDMDKIRLFPNHVPYFDGSKYKEHAMVSIFVPDAPNPNIIMKPHYPKELVYANNEDRSMEEIKALLYMEKRKRQLDSKHRAQSNESLTQSSATMALNHRIVENDHQRYSISMLDLQRQPQTFEHQQSIQNTRDFVHSKHGAENLILEKEQCDSDNLFQVTQYDVKSRNLVGAHLLNAEQNEMSARECQEDRLVLQSQSRESHLEDQGYAIKQKEFERLKAERLEAERIEAERIEAERIEAQRMEAEFSAQQKIQSHSSDYIHQHHTHPSTETDERLSQSLTMNTKEAMSIVQGLWNSSDTAVVTTPQYRNTPLPLMVDNREKLSFNIHMDSTMTQNVISGNKHHSEYSMQPYNDQENHQTYSANYSNNEHQTSYGAHSLPNPFYQMQPHHSQHVQPSHSQHHHQHHHVIQQVHAHSPHHQQPLLQPHLQSHSQIEHQGHGQPNQQTQISHHVQQHQHSSEQMSHMQHPNCSNILTNDSYQQYHSSLDTSQAQHNLQHQKQIHYAPYSEPDNQQMLNYYFNKPYKMPHELPYIKSSATNRRDFKYLESAENKENAIGTEYNGPAEDNIAKQLDANNIYIDESLGIRSPPESNDIRYTEEFNINLCSSTPMNNHHFRPSFRSKDASQYSNQNLSQTVPDIPINEGQEKLSIILESTREYISSSSGNSAYTRSTAQLHPGDEYSEHMYQSNQHLYDQKMRAQIQAVHAQSPRTVQRNVDEITSEIKNNCDLRKSISFKFSNEETPKEKIVSMECEDPEPMEEPVDEKEEFQIPSGNIDPFDKNLIAGLLKKIKFPQAHHNKGFIKLNTNLNKFVPSTMITLGTDAYDLDKCLGKGMYGTVFKGTCIQTGQTLALKMQRPAWVWEYYIASEIKNRLTNPHMLRGYMDVTAAYVADNSSVLVSEYSKYGTLLAVTNQIKIATGKPLSEPLAIFFTIEILQIVEYLHKCQIIHGDIKPDNFLLMRLPTEHTRPTIQLIDFGRSIDMSLFPENTKFTYIIKTEEFTCIEMQTGRPWTYQTDLYCLAATSHCLLFGNYMRVSHIEGRWFINAKVPRYAKKAAWEQFFSELLNIESCETMPDLTKLRNMMERALSETPGIQERIRSFCNILNKR
ncbi:probable inactive serine/threonine-protein kinase bub1 [Prorops nasuta]|uniref:probable inactive serine/threonine-protein kinase bub1 n=1 Tax=Prorops nasuta TaxID=863751 RepID=UPI0034CDAA87